MGKYPPRPYKPCDKTIDAPLDICDCGHPDYVHYSVDIRGYGECGDCMCPAFNFQHKSTQRQYFKVREVFS